MCYRDSGCTSSSSTSSTTQKSISTNKNNNNHYYPIISRDKTQRIKLPQSEDFLTTKMLSSEVCHNCCSKGRGGVAAADNKQITNNPKNKQIDHTNKQTGKNSYNKKIVNNSHSYGDELCSSVNCRLQITSCSRCQSFSSSSSCSPTPSSSSSSYSKDSISFKEHNQHYHSALKGWKPFLSRNLTLGLLLLLLPYAMSNPLRMSESSSSTSSIGETHIRHHQRPVNWVNPCRIPVLVPSLGHDIEIQAESDIQIFQHILTQAGKAEHQAKTFLGDFFKESFGMTMHPQNDHFKDIHYDWLQNISETVGKYLGEDVNPAKMAQLTVEDTLRAMYSALQKFAVGLEQVVLDQGIYGGSFYQNFQDAEFQLKYVLCEIQLAMLEKNIYYEDITGKIMSQPLRELEDRTTRNMRDWLIFRDYVNALEYMRFTFKFFINKIKNE